MPTNVDALTLAFATGECGAETWDGLDGARFAEANLPSLVQAGIGYIISTGGEAGSFTCGSDAGMDAFVGRYRSTRLIGFDFDIERGQSEAIIASLVSRIRRASERYPALRFSFTLATWGASDGSNASVNADGERVMRAIRASDLRDYYVNLMVMNYGAAEPRNCVVAMGVCDMGASAIRAVRNFHATYGVPFDHIEVTPMIGVNDVVHNVFGAVDAVVLTRFVRDEGLGGVHFWSLDRDTACAADAPAVTGTCNGLQDARPWAFTTAFGDARARR